MVRKSNVLCVLCFALVLATTAQSQTNDAFIYSVKVVCSEGQANLPFTVSNGGVTDIAETLVNLHNFSQLNVNYTFRVVQPFSSTSPGAVFSPSTDTLATFSARTFDCTDFIILQQGNPVFPATEGFLVIESPVRIQVVAVYRSQSLATAFVDKYDKEVYWSGAKNVFGAGEVPPFEDVPLSRASDEQLEMAQEQAGSVKMPIFPMGQQAEIQAAGMGLGLGVGSSRGTGVGVGSGSSIDVEYIEPIAVPAKLDPGF